MTIKETVTGKEKNVRELLEKLRNNLNEGRVKFNNNPNDWTYLTSLSFSELKLRELMDFFESSSKQNI